MECSERLISLHHWIYAKTGYGPGQGAVSDFALSGGG